MAYFEVFYAWAKVQMKSVFGNFMKEVFSRIVITILLMLVYWNLISVLTFLNAMVGMYILRTLIMQAYALRSLRLKLDFNFAMNISLKSRVEKKQKRKGTNKCGRRWLVVE